MQKFEKFLLKQDENMRRRLRAAIVHIAQNSLSQLDVKPLKGYKNWFRCRIGNLRIIFIREASGNRIVSIDMRGRVYKRH